jgi:flagellar FliJ protein
MPPDFRFQTILELRKRTEDEQQMVLAQALQQAASLRAQWERLQVERARLAEKLKAKLHGPLDASEVEQHYRYLGSLDQQLAHLAEEVADADEAVLAQRHRLGEAMKERKTMDRLKENDLQAFLDNYQKKEQKETDELNLTRRSRQTQDDDSLT